LASASLSLGIGITHPRYLHPWSFSITPLGIGFPSLLVLASPLPRYRHPALSTPLSSVSVSLALWHRRYQASVSFSCLRTPLPSSASPSLSTGFVSSLPLYKPVSPLFLHTNQPPYPNTQTFSAEQSSLQLFSTASVGWFSGVKHHPCQQWRASPARRCIASCVSCSFGRQASRIAS
jgi:hypothetical protein